MSDLRVRVDGLTFGQYIRASRLRWHPAPNRQYLMRLSVDTPGRYLVELHPFGLVSHDKRAKELLYVLWWETEDGGRAFFDYPALRAIKSVKQYVRMYIDDTGWWAGKEEHDVSWPATPGWEYRNRHAP